MMIMMIILVMMLIIMMLIMIMIIVIDQFDSELHGDNVFQYLPLK